MHVFGKNILGFVLTVGIYSPPIFMLRYDTRGFLGGCASNDFFCFYLRDCVNQKYVFIPFLFSSEQKSDAETAVAGGTGGERRAAPPAAPATNG